MNNVVPTSWSASTHLNPVITTYADLAYRVKNHFGFPISVFELTDEQLATFIDDAVERFTQYAGYTEEYLIFCDNLYVPGCGVRLDQIGRVQCNLQQCVLTSEETYTELVEVSEELLSVSAGLLSVTPFNYIEQYDKCDPAAIQTVAPSGQQLEIRFNPSDPWDFASVCLANCIRINPKNSTCEELSTSMPDYIFDLEQYIEANPTWLEVLSSSEIPLSAYPLSSLPCDILNDIPLSTFELSVFYDPNTLIGVETTACINIKDGKGYIYPKCDTSAIDTCEPLTAQWFNNPISLLEATHFISPNIPVCMGDSIALDTFDGIVGTFTLCNSAINTFGPFPITNVQFLVDYKPPVDILFQRFCDLQNGGFVLRKWISDHSECVPSTPEPVEVDVEFLKISMEEITSTRVVETSSFYDESLNVRRKVHGVFSAEPGNEMGYGGFGGNNILFNFDYSLMSSIMGYNMTGQRSSLWKNGYDLTTFHLARSFIETTRKMLRYHTYTFDADTQLLKITPEPRQSRYDNVYVDNSDCMACYMVGVYVEKPVEQILKQPWIREWVIASCAETLGLIRSQYGTVTLYGGATVTGESLVTMGQTQKEKLLDQLRKENYYSAPPLIFVG